MDTNTKLCEKEAPETGRLNVRAMCCSKCLFGKNPLLAWEPLGREKIEKILGMESHFTCHEYKNVMCRGFYSRHGAKIWYIRAANAANAVSFINS